MTACHPYDGKFASLATRHGKWELIAPAMAEMLSLGVVDTTVDTDSLGTFSGETPRKGTPLETVVAKARLGMQSSGLSIGLANEGTIGPHPSFPFVISDIELIVLVDDERGIIVAESEIELGVPSFMAETSLDGLEELSFDGAGFPDHGLIVMTKGSQPHIVKGIHDRELLAETVRICVREYESPTVIVQSDFRAHHHPTRRTIIERAAWRLARRLKELCPCCGVPGWGIGRYEYGAPCAYCGTATSQRLRDVMECAGCGHEEVHEVAYAGGVDPMHCPRCNP